MTDHKAGCTADPDINPDLTCEGCWDFVRAVSKLEMDSENAWLREAEYHPDVLEDEQAIGRFRR